MSENSTPSLRHLKPWQQEKGKLSFDYFARGLLMGPVGFQNTLRDPVLFSDALDALLEDWNSQM